jgi:cytochrome c-type biogenesis protein CcmE
MTPLVRRRLALIGTLGIAGAILGVVALGGIGENLVYFWGPADVLAAGDAAIGADIRLGGVVQADSKWDAETQDLRFSVSDQGQTIAVQATGAPPEMFREGIGVVVEGTLNPDGVFVADRVLVKHSNEYKVPDEGAELSDLYRTVEDMTDR